MPTTRMLLIASLFASPLVAAPPDATKSAAAVKALTVALDAKPEKLADLLDQDFAKTPLTKADAAKARDLIWAAHVRQLKADRPTEMQALKLTDGDKELKYVVKVFGEKPTGGHSLWISMHGGGNAPPEVNDRGWEGYKRYYTLDEGIHVIPRAPSNTWNMWFEPHVDRLFARLIESYVAVEGVNPNRVYILGYSAGGDGVYQMAPRMADRWAAAAMMAGHPNDASPLNLRNVPFALQMGGKDAAYNRNKVAQEWGQKLFELQMSDLHGYSHFFKMHEDKAHDMRREDKIALPWMAKHSRNPVPDRVVWRQTGVHERSYWLAVPKGTGKGGAVVSATRFNQTVNVTDADGLTKLIVRFDDRMQDLDQPVIVALKGKEVFNAAVPRTAGTLLKTLLDRGDPKLMFDAEAEVELPQLSDEVKATLAFIAKLRDPETGAYAVNPPKDGEKPKPSLRAVNGAVKSIKYLGGEVPEKEKLTKFVMSCYDDKTGTFAEPGGKPDVAVTSIGVMAAVELGLPKEKYKKAMEYLGANAKTFEEVRIAAAAVEAVGLLECGIDMKPWVKEAFGTLNTAADARDAGGAMACILRLRPGSVMNDAKKECLQLIHDGQRTDGGWGKKGDKVSDAETTYRVMRALMMLKEKPKDTAGLKKFLTSCRRADGGYGVDATTPSSMSGVYYFATVTKWLKEMEK